MSRDSVIDSLGRIDDTMIESVEKLRQKPRKKRIRMRWVAVAACLAVLVVSAEASSGLVSNLLAPLYGGAQTELVDSIGVPVGASATVAGYTLTADAIIGDRHNLAIVYTLCREDGQPMPDNISFGWWDNSVNMGLGDSSMIRRLSEDGLSIQIIEQLSNSYGLLFRRNAQVRLEDLICYDDEETHLIAQGVWELNFTVRYKDTTVKLPIDELEVIGSEGYRYQIHKIFLSPIGLHMKLTAPNTINRNDPYSKIMPDFQVSVVLQEGTVVELLEAGRGGRGEGGSDLLDAHYEVMFNPPIPLDTIKALIICDTTYEINTVQ